MAAAAIFHADTVKTGILMKKGTGITKSFQARFFCLTAMSELNYWHSKEEYESSDKRACNSAPFYLKDCVVKFDMLQDDASHRHAIIIIPKSIHGGPRELELEATSKVDRDNWRAWVRGALAFLSENDTFTSSALPSSSPQHTDSSARLPSRAPESERSTELGRVLTECRLEEHIHNFVGVEGFCTSNALVNLYESSPVEFDNLFTRVGLKLGQSRKLRKKLGIPIDMNVNRGTNTSEVVGRTGSQLESGVGLLVHVNGPPPIDPATTHVLSAEEEKAWELVRILREENTVLRSRLEKLENTMAAGPHSSSSLVTGSPESGLIIIPDELCVGKLLTNQIPVVVAHAETIIASISADAGEEDKAVLRLKFHEANVGFDVSVSAFGEPLVVSKVFKGGPADVKGVEVNDLVIEINGSPVLTDHTEAELKEMFKKFRRPVTIGFYRLRKVMEQAESTRRASLLPASLTEREARGSIRAVASLHSSENSSNGVLIRSADELQQPRVIQVDGCPDADCNGAYTVQPHRFVNGKARYLKNHSFYYLYRMTTGQWMITWFEPDIEQDKGEYISEQVLETPEQPSYWIGHATRTRYPGMVVYIRGSIPMVPSTHRTTGPLTPT